MTLDEARSILRQVSGKQYPWLKAWGIGTIRRAIWTVRNRKSATTGDRERAEELATKLARGW